MRVIIIGAGIDGLSAALSLPRRGFRGSLVLEGVREIKPLVVGLSSARGRPADARSDRAS